MFSRNEPDEQHGGLGLGGIGLGGGLGLKAGYDASMEAEEVVDDEDVLPTAFGQR